MPARFTASPSRAGASTPCSSSFPQAAAPVTRTRRQAARVRRRRTTGGASLMPGGASRIHARWGAEARGLGRLVARDRRPLERLLRWLLEDHPQPVERPLRLAPDPTRRADLPEAIDRGGGLAVGGELDAGRAAPLGRELV